MEDKFLNFSNAISRLKESIAIKNPDEVQIDGVIQRFEFTFELAWKLLKKILIENGITDEIIGPKGVLKVAFSEGIIKNGEIWISMLEDRNDMSHRYDYEKSRNIYIRIKNEYTNEFVSLQDELKRRI